MRPETFEEALTSLINRHSIENGSNTPDFLLAEYLLGCLENWNKYAIKRDTWYGIKPAPGWSGRREDV